MPGPSLAYERDPDGFDPEAAPGERPRHPHDPRAVVRNHRERGPARFPRQRPGWTYEDIARAAGVTVAAVKKAVLRGRLDPEDFAAVLEWAVQTRTRRDRA